MTKGLAIMTLAAAVAAGTHSGLALKNNGEDDVSEGQGGGTVTWTVFEQFCITQAEADRLRADNAGKEDSEITAISGTWKVNDADHEVSADDTYAQGGFSIPLSGFGNEPAGGPYCTDWNQPATISMQEPFVEEEGYPTEDDADEFLELYAWKKFTNWGEPFMSGGSRPEHEEDNRNTPTKLKHKQT